MPKRREEQFDRSGFEVGQLYDRPTVASIGGVAPLSSTREWTGIVEFANYVLLFVNLDQSGDKEDPAYDDYFEGPRFYWDSQNRNTQNSPVIMRLIDGEAEVLLFCRLRAKTKSKTEPFVFCGGLDAIDYHGEQPVHFQFLSRDYGLSQSVGLDSLYSWNPGRAALDEATDQSVKGGSVPDIEGTQAYPVSAFSWEVLSEAVAVKFMDKSAFLHSGTGIPQEVGGFFGLDGGILEETEDIDLVAGSQTFSGRIEMDAHGRLRLFWRADFNRFIREKYADIYSRHESGVEVLERPGMQFKRASSNVYLIAFDSEASGGQSAEASYTAEAERSYAASRGQRYAQSTARKEATELYAMDAAKTYLENEGYEWVDTSAHAPYDLMATRLDEEIFVEVKGTRSGGETVFLTKNEVAHARDHKDRSMLFVLHHIHLEGPDAALDVSGGIQTVIYPWSPDEADLKALNYEYRVPE